jgi:murein endopeptidase
MQILRAFRYNPLRARQRLFALRTAAQKQAAVMAHGNYAAGCLNAGHNIGKCIPGKWQLMRDGKGNYYRSRMIN